MNFTNSPYEKMMKKKPKAIHPAYPKAPKGTLCEGCPYWHGIVCIFCFRSPAEERRDVEN